MKHITLMFLHLPRKIKVFFCIYISLAVQLIELQIDKKYDLNHRSVFIGRII
jgi:hypothetical protein